MALNTVQPQADQHPAHHILYRKLDGAGMTPLHWKIWFLSSMGIFLDGFDLFVISIALPLIIAQFSPSPFMTGAIAAATVLGSVFGAAFGGKLTDMWGRKSIYIIDLLFFLLFSLMTAFSWDVLSLIAFRFLLGLGIGADYPICASYVSEFMPAKIRGRMLIGAFSFQAVGMFAAALCGLGIMYLFPEIVSWRIMLVAGCIPALLILIFRLRVPESPRWYIEHGQAKKAADVVSQICPDDEDEIRELVIEEEEEFSGIPESEKKQGYGILFSPKYLKKTVFASVPWFCMDVATYGVGLFTPILIGIMIGADGAGLGVIAQDFYETGYTAVLDIFLVLGFILNILFIERLGRRRLQIAGFIGMAAGLLILAVASSALSAVPLIFAGFILFNLMMNFGPNATTFIMPAEIFPTRIRATAHGFAAAAGKAGAVLGIVLFPVLKEAIGVPLTLLLVAGVCVTGLLVTAALGIETRGRSLEEIDAGIMPKKRTNKAGVTGE